MVKHIVLWRLKDEAQGNTKAHNAQQIKQSLEALNGRIAGLRKLEVGVDFSRTDSAADVALCAEFNSRADLEAYLVHPEHVKAGTFIREVVCERRMADYEVA